MAYRFIWTQPLVMCLLKNYKNHPLLYIPELPEHNDKTERRLAMQNIRTEIIKEFPYVKLTIDGIRKKMQSLKSQYNREQQSAKNESTLWCFQQMQIIWGTNIGMSNDENERFDDSADDNIILDKKRLQLNERCRVCLIATSDVVKLDSNISIQQEDIIIFELLASIADVKFDEETNKPQMICASCRDVAKIAYEFKLKCERSDIILADELFNMLINENNYVDMDEIKEEYIYIDEESMDKEEDTVKDFREMDISTNKSNINEEINVPHEEINAEKIIVESDADHSNKNEEINSNVSIEKKNHKPYTCTICNKKFQRRQHLSNHLWLHKNQRKKKPLRLFKCRYCDFVGDSSVKLGKHSQREHNEMKKIPCNKCDKKFMTKNNLRTHQHTHTDKSCTCEYCGNIFSTVHNLKQHHRIHTGEKPFSCTLCGKQFSHQSSLYTHNLYLHSDKRDFKCKHCSADFKRAGALTMHLRVHTKEKPFKCAVCSTSARDMSTLQRHMKIHSGKFDFKCDVCGKNFVRKSSLKVHMMTHTGEKPYVCDICGNRFSQAHCLRSHMATQHQIVVKTKADEMKT